MAASDPAAGATSRRLLPHTADIAVSAWALSEGGCLAEAVDGLVESFAEVAADVPRSTRQLMVQAPTPEERLVAVLEEVVYLLDVEGVVPAGTRVEAVTGEEVRGVFEVVPLAATRPVGPPPKAVTRHGLRVEHTGRRRLCEVVVDV